MKKVLLVDVGNTRLKWGWSVENKIVERNLFAWEEGRLAESLGSQWGKLDQPEGVYVSNVAGEVIKKTISEWCVTNWKIKPDFATVEVFCCGVKNSYSEPEKLGIDRWLAMISAWDSHKKNVCVIDCGSAVTIDVVNEKGIHQGGMISPGLALSGRALTDHTHALIAEQRKSVPMLANNTEDAINSGCYHQLIGSIHHVLKKIWEQFDSDMKYIITGGDAELVMTAVDIKMSHEPDLILKGLYIKLSSGNKKIT